MTGEERAAGVIGALAKAHEAAHAEADYLAAWYLRDVSVKDFAWLVKQLEGHGPGALKDSPTADGGDD